MGNRSAFACNIEQIVSPDGLPENRCSHYMWSAMAIIKKTVFSRNPAKMETGSLVKHRSRTDKPRTVNAA
jgi:hypothetical protein